MSRTPYRVEVGRVVIKGAAAEASAAPQLGALVEQAVAREAAGAPLRATHAVRATLRIEGASLATAGDVAAAVALGVARALGGEATRG